MQRAIDKNKYSEIKRLVPTATISDLDYAINRDNINAVFLLLENEMLALELYKRCDDLTLEEKIFLCKGTNPRDIATLIKNLT